MDRIYNDHEDAPANVKFFFGLEVEATPLQNELTLFVVGQQTDQDIDQRLSSVNNDPREDKIRHIYFAANHSYDQFKDYAQLYRYLERGFHVTFETTVDRYAQVMDLLPLIWIGANKFVVMLSAVIPKATSTRASVILKIDDLDENRTNLGVWCEDIKDLTAVYKSKTFTPFSSYGGDKILD